jgi:hypothetical protein
MSKNQKIIIGIVIAIVVVIILVGIMNKNKTQEMVDSLTKQALISSQNKPTPTKTPSKPEVQVSQAPTAGNSAQVAKDPQNATYTIDGKSVTLTNGKAEEPAAPGSASMITTTMFGEPTVGDLNGDGANDAGVILVVDGSGSGTFFYAAAALINTSTSTYNGTNAIILGDRISPQTKDIQNQIYTVNFAERKEGEPMTTSPSVGVSKYFKVNGTTLVETSN